MLVLFDQGTPVGIRDSLKAHIVKTAWETGWSTLTNGELLKEAEQAGFQVLLTTDKNLAYQQNLTGRKIAIIVLGRARWSLIQKVLNEVVEAVDAVKEGTYTVIDVPEP